MVQDDTHIEFTPSWEAVGPFTKIKVWLNYLTPNVDVIEQMIERAQASSSPLGNDAGQIVVELTRPAPVKERTGGRGAGKKSDLMSQFGVCGVRAQFTQKVDDPAGEQAEEEQNVDKKELARIKKEKKSLKAMSKHLLS